MMPDLFGWGGVRTADAPEPSFTSFPLTRESTAARRPVSEGLCLAAVGIHRDLL